jgi:hypothetical protein
MTGASAAVRAIEAERSLPPSVRSLQELHAGGGRKARTPARGRAVEPTK